MSCLISTRFFTEPTKKSCSASNDKCVQDYCARLHACLTALDDPDLSFLFAQSNDQVPAMPDIPNEYDMCPILLKSSQYFLEESHPRNGKCTAWHPPFSL